MTEQHPFKWRHYEAEIILLCVRSYLRYSLSDRDFEEIMLERGLHADHTCTVDSVFYHFRLGNPLVVMVEPTQDRNGDHLVRRMLRGP
jgi:transposase-like protein